MYSEIFFNYSSTIQGEDSKGVRKRMSLKTLENNRKKSKDLKIYVYTSINISVSPPLMPEIYPHLLPEEYELDFELVWLGASQQVAGETP